MEDQNQPNSQSVASNPTQIVDVVTQPKPVEPTAASVAVPHPAPVSEPSIESAPAQGPSEGSRGDSTTQTAQESSAQTSSADVDQPDRPKKPSVVPVGPIIVAVIVFIVLAAVALMAFRQGL